MRKLYGFLLAMFVLAAVSTGVAQAQTFAITDYLVRTANASGANYQEITGTHISNLEASNYQIYYLISSPIQVPFNFRFLNQQFTTANTFYVNGTGDVFFSPTWGTGTNNYGDYDSYDCYSYCSSFSTWQGYSYPYEEYDAETDYTSYGYYPNFKISPMAAYHYQNPATQIGDFEYTVLGSAPNRSLVVQSKNILANYYAYNPSLSGNWQAVVYENGISNFQVNYGHQNSTTRLNGSAYDSWGEAYNYGSYGYDYSFTGIKAGGISGSVPANNAGFLMIGWFGSAAGGINDHTYGANVANTGTNPKFGYNVYGGGDQYYLDNSGNKISGTNSYCLGNGWSNLPTTSYHIFIAYPYDLAASTIINPGDQQIKNLSSTQVPTATITNSGSSTPTSCTVQLNISLQGTSTPIYSQTQTLTGAQIPAPFTSKTITFPSFTVPSYGIYYDTMIVYGLAPTADQNPSDNVSTNQWTCSPPNNIKAVAILSPVSGARSPVAVSTPISFRFQNIGANDQNNVPLSVVVKDPGGNVVFRDTIVKTYFPSPNTSVALATLDTEFDGWTPSTNGNYSVCGISLLASDQLRADDTSCAVTGVRYEYDAAGISVVNPQPDEEKPYTLRWQPSALFQTVGVSDMFDVQARVIIKRCTDNSIVFQADSIIPEMNVDQNQVRFSFPSKQGSYDITRLTPGCYNICAIAKYPSDGNKSNDTACSTFSIIDRLKGNIFVGVGQRFQSIHAAVDSMLFRGIGGNLNLILTDANYTENGSYRVSSQQGAIDFTGIRGLTDTSWVTWTPKPGVNPTITFTGSHPYCFYFGDNQGGHVRFEGYNPLGVPIADKIVAEPNKRGMTIIDNQTVGGGVFGIEEGASNLQFRNLVLHSNGNKPNSLSTGGSMYANDSSAVIRIYNEQNRTYYIQHVVDTVGIHNILVENCELGNAKYGLYDHGLHDQFELGPSKFKDWKNYDNVFARNTIGTQANPLGYAGISFNSERNLMISHNEISWVDDSLTKLASGIYAAPNVYGINQYSGILTTQPGSIQDSVGNVINVSVNGNRIRNLRAVTGDAYGIAFQQASTIYTTGGSLPVISILPTPTNNRTTNNMIFNLRVKSGTAYPLTYVSGSTRYSADGDSVYNNSIATNNASINVKVWNSKHVFLWNNIIQNLGQNGSYTNYSLQMPRPFTTALSSDYNLFDLRTPTAPATTTFATIQEYDPRPTSGVNLGPVRIFRKLSDWRSYTSLDLHSVTGDPRFASDTAHMPSATSYISSPANNNGAWLGSASQALDFDGDSRLQGNNTPDIGADEFDGFQYTNDLAVLAITQPAGYSQTSDTALITLDNPIALSAVVKNLSSQAVFGRTVSATLEVAISGGTYQTIFSKTTANENWDVNESKNQYFQGPSITPAQAMNGVFRLTVSVSNDQDNTNNSQVRIFRVLLKSNAMLVSYNGATLAGRQNRDSVYRALGRLGITGYDTLDRNSYGNADLDYSPWWTMIWSSGDPTQPVVSGAATGQAGLSYKETQEVEKYLRASQSYAKKSLIIAGQNIAFQNAFAMPNNIVTDTEFVNTWLHARYVANSPVTGTYSGPITGGYSDYWTFADNIVSASPDVIKPAITTPLVGPEVNWFAYSYGTHTNYPSDSGAGVTYYNPLMNTVFYGFDWSNPVQTNPGENGTLTSGVTRVLKGALDFVLSHAGTILPVDFVNASATRMPSGTSIFLKWETARQQDVARFDIESLNDQNAWTSVGSVSADHLNYTHTGVEPSQSYTYRIAAVDQSGAKTYSTQMDVAPAAASGLTLEQNFPNPTQGVTSVRFTLPTASVVSLRILDVTGKVLATEFANESMSAGDQMKSIDLSELASGSYIYELTAVDANGQTVSVSKKMTLNK